MKKQFIAKLLVLAMVLALAPAAALTAGAAGSTDACNTGCNTGGSSVADTIVVAATTTVNADDIAIEDNTATVEAKVVGGTATVTVTEKAVENLFKQAAGTVVLKIEAKGATKVDVSFPAKALTSAGEKSGAALSVQLGDVATITVPNEGLTSVFGQSGTVKISAQNSGASIGFSIQAGGRALKNIKGLKVEF